MKKNSNTRVVCDAPTRASATPDALLQRFWAKTTPAGDCVVWTGALNKPGGYGQFAVGRKRVRAHRWIYEQTHGPIPDGSVVIHRCDTPTCVNPSHLAVGTQAENIKDARRKGRMRDGGNRGVKNGRATLTETQVRAIRDQFAAGTRVASIARNLEVSRRAVEYVIHEGGWSHVR